MNDSPLAVPPELARALAGVQRVVVLTGAGVSAESGIPTFRDALTGLWARFDPLELATPEAFARQPKLVWDWYAERRAAVLAAVPNPGHFALAAIERRVPDYLLATQNVDGLHERAAVIPPMRAERASPQGGPRPRGGPSGASRRMVELHGSIARVRCSREDRVVDAWDAANADEPPRCAHCGAFLRPDVVWFGESLPAEGLALAEDAARRCEVMIVAGTSAEVYPAAALPSLARDAGAIVVEVNPGATPLSPFATYALRGPSGVVLPSLLAAAWPGSASSGRDGGGGAT